MSSRPPIDPRLRKHFHHKPTMVDGEGKMDQNRFARLLEDLGSMHRLLLWLVDFVTSGDSIELGKSDEGGTTLTLAGEWRIHVYKVGTKSRYFVEHWEDPGTGLAWVYQFGQIRDATL